MSRTANEGLMRKALSLALNGRGRVSPNPLVGAIIVSCGEIVGRGFHDGCGKPHAEVNALAEAGERSRGSAMYVTLEPCSTWGRTPPCTEAIVKAGLSRVFVATTDPNPSVSGKGIQLLRESGVEVEVGLLREEAEKQNEYYMHFMMHKLPFVTLKIAATMDGKIATRTGQSKWITGEGARQDVQSMRNDVDAILVGVGTILADNPSLTLRGAGTGSPPRRIILDSKLRIPSDAAVLDGSATTIIATAKDADRGLENAIVWSMGEDGSTRVDLSQLLKRAAQEGITSILVEGGAQVFSSFLDQGKVDKIVLYVAPRIMGSGIDAFGGITSESLEKALELDIDDVRMVGRDVRLTAYLRTRQEPEAHESESI